MSPRGVHAFRPIAADWRCLRPIAADWRCLRPIAAGCGYSRPIAADYSRLRPSAPDCGRSCPLLPRLGQGDARYLIMDPHYTGADDLSLIRPKWVGWKSADSPTHLGTKLFKSDTFYMFCLPQRPSDV